jgi:hypothetical protein
MACLQNVGGLRPKLGLGSTLTSKFRFLLRRVIPVGLNGQSLLTGFVSLGEGFCFISLWTPLVAMLMPAGMLPMMNKCVNVLGWVLQAVNTFTFYLVLMFLQRPIARCEEWIWLAHVLVATLWGPSLLCGTSLWTAFSLPLFVSGAFRTEFLHLIRSKSD